MCVPSPSGSLRGPRCCTEGDGLLTRALSGSHSLNRTARSSCTWNVPHGSVELKSGEIHLWRPDLNRNTNALVGLEQTLSPEELARAGEFRFERDRGRYILAHGALRTIVSGYLNTTPDKPVFRHGAQGKPELASGALHFSMAHSCDLVVWAISGTGPIGVDVEYVRSGVEQDLDALLSSRARRLLRALPRPARCRAFFQGWTRLEAYVKARGEGLESGLGIFDAFLASGHPLVLQPSGDPQHQGRWCIHDVSPRPGYVGAVAVPWERCSLKYWTWKGPPCAGR